MRQIKGVSDHFGRSLIGLLTCIMLLTACTDQAPGSEENAEKHRNGNEVLLVLGAYSVVKDAFHEIVPAFREYWLKETGQRVAFQESYEASGTQARAIVGGFEADVAILSMEGDIDKIADVGLITRDWRANEYRGMVTSSVAALGTREGNPLGIRDWSDLTQPNIKLMYPNPRTSGGAQWVINAIYGAGLKQSEKRSGVPDPPYAEQFLAAVHRNVESMDKSGRASMAAFEYGVGDVIVTYENELLARIRQGVPYEIVIPDDTIRIDNPVAVIDRNADRHGVKDVAEAFVQFLYSDTAQRIFAEHGFRPVTPKMSETYAERYTIPSGLFDVDDLGGWEKVRKELYGKGGVWDRVLAGSHNKAGGKQ